MVCDVCQNPGSTMMFLKVLTQPIGNGNLRKSSGIIYISNLCGFLGMASRMHEAA